MFFRILRVLFFRFLRDCRLFENIQNTLKCSIFFYFFQLWFLNSPGPGVPEFGPIKEELLQARPGGDEKTIGWLEIPNPEGNLLQLFYETVNDQVRWQPAKIWSLFYMELPRSTVTFAPKYDVTAKNCHKQLLFFLFGEVLELEMIAHTWP